MGDTANVNSGSILCAPPIMFGGTLNWAGGSLLGGITIASNGVANLKGSSAKSLYGSLTNGGTINWSGGTINLYNNGSNYLGSIYNQSGALFDIQSDNDLNAFLGPETIQNSGTFRKSAGAGTTSISPEFNSTGSVIVQNGVLRFYGGGKLGGTFNAAAGDAIQLVGGSFVPDGLPVFTGAGTKQMIGGSLTLSNDIVPGLELAGGNLYLAPTFQGGSITNLTLPRMTLLSTNEVSGVLNWTSGMIATPMTVRSNAIMNVVGTGAKYLCGPLNNAGAIHWSGGDINVYNNGTICNGAINNQAGGLFDIQGDNNLNALVGPETLNNFGVLRKSAGSGTTIYSRVVNYGHIEVLNGTLDVAGSYSQTNASLSFRILNAASYGRLVFHSTFGMDGAFQAQIAGSFQPILGEQFTFITYPSRAGSFATIETPPGTIWQSVYGPTGFSLLATFLAGPPAILSGPRGTNASIGDDVRFCVTAAGTPPLFYQWRHNGINIPGGTNTCLFLTNVQLTNGGSYDVIVLANGGETILSEPALLLINVPSLAAGDNFAQRVLIEGSSGLAAGSNEFATVEAGEPIPAGKPGGKSVWYTWQAPAKGIVTFSTVGSSFDTLLGVYKGSAVNALSTLAGDDDSGGSFSSLVRVNVQAGVFYQIQVDGFLGASGNYILSWNFQERAEELPVILINPESQTVGLGGSCTFEVTVQEQPFALSYRWFLNGQQLLNATNQSLIVSNVQFANLGSYYVRVTAGNQQANSVPASLQINQTGESIQPVLAYDKFGDALISTNLLALGAPGSTGGFRGVPKASSLARGYTGSQIFSTVGATTDPTEPPFCGAVGGASTWVKLLAEETGTVFLNTDGSSFDTLLAIYSRSANGTLQMLACDNNSGTNGKTSSLNIPVQGGTTNFIVIDGVNGAMGTLVLNYSLVTKPQLVSLGKTLAGAYHLQVIGHAGMKFNLQQSSNMVNWSNLLTTNSLISTFDFIDLQSIVQPRRFYRANMLP
ncbi:MAG: hypothetical protein JWM16_3157 [Verrucomicrobiales bacterium]|nr:hypothetical protein [Verrucomicrobiales bacterium]